MQYIQPFFLYDKYVSACELSIKPLDQTPGVLLKKVNMGAYPWSHPSFLKAYINMLKE